MIINNIQNYNKNMTYEVVNRDIEEIMNCLDKGCSLIMDGKLVACRFTDLKTLCCDNFENSNVYRKIIKDVIRNLDLTLSKIKEKDVSPIF